MPVRPPAVRHSLFTIITPIDPARVAQLRASLARCEAAVQAGSSPFTALPMLHFCSLTVCEDPAFEPILVFEINVDGSPMEFIALLCTTATALLHDIYATCTKYPGAAVDGAGWRKFLGRHIVYADAAFVGNVGRSARRVRDEAALVVELQTFLDRLANTRDMRPPAIAAAARRFVRASGRWDEVLAAPARLSPADRMRRWLTAVAIGVGVLVLSIAAWPLAVIFFVVLRRLEASDSIDIPGPPRDRLHTLTEREDHYAINHMASLAPVKPGPFRRRTLRLVLFFANLLARISTRGRLIGLDSLHFAHWSLIDDGQRLLFLTNYDGSWENYLDDFIAKAAPGLTAIWSNTRNFPRTAFLMCGGARDERNFKAIARTTQVSSSVWYGAYLGLPVTVIENNSAICAGLALPVPTFDAAAWLRRLG